MKTSISVSLLLLLVASGQKISADAPARTGQGDVIYEVVRDWPSLPEGIELGSLHGDMAADSKGNVYLSTGPAILVFGPDGKYLRNLGADTGGVHGMKVREQEGEEFLFIAQTGPKAVAKLKLDGTRVWMIAGPPKVEGMYPNPGAYNPTDVDVAPDGTIYIADGYGMSLMHIHDKERDYVKTFGGKGNGEGQFNVCHNVLVDTRGEKPSLIISDRENNRLLSYDMDGNFISVIADDMRQPCAADLFGGRLAVGELGGRVTVFDEDNKLVSRLGDEPADRVKGNGAPPDKWVEGALLAVHGLTFDPKGALYAMEWNQFGRATKYVPVEAGK